MRRSKAGRRRKALMKTVFKILICAAASIAAALCAAFSTALLIPVLALAVFMGVYWGTVYLLPPLIGAAAGTVIFLGGDVGALPELFMYLLAPAFLTIIEKRRLPHRYGVLGLAVIFCLGLYLSMALGSILAGKPPYYGVLETWDNVYYPRILDLFSGAAGGADTLEALADIRAVIPDTLMWTCILTGEAYSMALVMLYRLWHRAFGVKPRRMADLPDWRLPKSFLIGSGMMLAAIGLVYAFGLAQANAIAYSLGLIIASLYGVQGAAYFMFMFRTVNAPAFMRVLLIVFTVLFFPFSLGFLAAFGLKEQITGKRAKIKKLIAERARENRPFSRADELAKYGYVREERAKPSRSRSDETDKNDNNGGEEPPVDE